LTSDRLVAKRRCMVSNRLLMASLCCISLCSCGKSPQSQTEIEKRLQDEAAKTETENRIQEQAAKIVAERERLAELQQEQREKVAADLASRTDTREAARAANLERAAAEQARREGITSELATFVDTLWIEVMRGNQTEALRMNGQPVRSDSVIVSPAGYSVKYTKHDGDYFWFTYDEDAFTLTLKKPAAGYASLEMRAKQPLADGFKVGQPLAGVPSRGFSAGGSISSGGLLVVNATYGADQTQRDVKDLVKSKIQNGRLDFRAHNGELGGDPIFGKVKTFYIKYVSNGRVLEKSFREGEHVSLP
jgi:hypothetical protein